MRRSSAVITWERYLDVIRNRCFHQGVKWQDSHLRDLFPGWLAGHLLPGRTWNGLAASLWARRCSGVSLMGGGGRCGAVCVRGALPQPPTPCQAGETPQHRAQSPDWRSQSAGWAAQEGPPAGSRCPCTPAPRTCRLPINSAPD